MLRHLQQAIAAVLTLSMFSKHVENGEESTNRVYSGAVGKPVEDAVSTLQAEILELDTTTAFDKPLVLEESVDM
jgi:hypothetical protein